MCGRSLGALCRRLPFFFVQLREWCVKKGKRNMKKEKHFVHFYQEIILKFHSTAPFNLLPITGNFFQKRITSAVLILPNRNDIV